MNLFNSDTAKPTVKAAERTPLKINDYNSSYSGSEFSSQGSSSGKEEKSPDKINTSHESKKAASWLTSSAGSNEDDMDEETSSAKQDKEDKERSEKVYRIIHNTQQRKKHLSQASGKLPQNVQQQLEAFLINTPLGSNTPTGASTPTIKKKQYVNPDVPQAPTTKAATVTNYDVDLPNRGKQNNNNSPFTALQQEQRQTSQLKKQAILERQSGEFSGGMQMEQPDNEHHSFIEIDREKHSIIFNNLGGNAFSRYAISLGFISVRQFASVYIPTFARQALAYAFARTAAHNPTALWIMGGLAAAYPTVLNIWGFLQDRHAGKKLNATFESLEEGLRTAIIDELKNQGYKVGKEETMVVQAFCVELVRELRTAHDNHDPFPDQPYAVTDSLPTMMDAVLKLARVNSTVNSIDIDYQPVSHHIDLEGTEDLENTEDLANSLHSSLNIGEQDSGDPLISDEWAEQRDPNVIFNRLEEKFKREIPKDVRKGVEEKIYGRLNEFKKTDLKDHYWGTPCSELCRAINIAVNTALSVASAYYKILPKIAPTLAAFSIYCVLRDIVQSVLKLPDGLVKLYMVPTLVTAFCYIFNQWVVSTAMSTMASPSGQPENFTNLTEFPPYSDHVQNDLRRSGINTVGEIFDLMTLILTHTWYSSQNFKIGFEIHRPSGSELIKTWTGVHTARNSLFISLLLASALFFEYVEIDPTYSVVAAAMLMALFDGGWLGSFYSGLVALATLVNWPYDSNAQSNEWR